MDQYPKYPKFVCDKCGKEANRLTCLNIYGKEPWKIKLKTHVFTKGLCEVCGKHTMVTRPREYYYPDFTLLINKNNE